MGNKEIIIWLAVLLAVYMAVEVFTPQIKGYLGEKYISIILSRLPKNHYRAINNVLMKKSNGETTQIDHIVVSNYGIFVIETKNYKGLITGGEYVAQWTKHMGRKKYKFQNPIRQNYGHIKAIEEALSIPKDAFIPIIVFSPDAKLKVNCKTPVINNGWLQKTITSYKEPKLGDLQVAEVEGKINALNIYTKKAMREHIRRIREKQSA